MGAGSDNNMKNPYIKPVMLQVELGTEQMVAESQVRIYKTGDTNFNQNDVNTSYRTKQRNVWDQQW